MAGPHAGGWKKFEGMRNLLTRSGRYDRARTLLERVLPGGGPPDGPAAKWQAVEGLPDGPGDAEVQRC